MHVFSSFSAQLQVHVQLSVFVHYLLLNVHSFAVSHAELWHGVCIQGLQEESCLHNSHPHDPAWPHQGVAEV